MARLKAGLVGVEYCDELMMTDELYPATQINIRYSHPLSFFYAGEVIVQFSEISLKFGYCLSIYCQMP